MSSETNLCTLIKEETCGRGPSGLYVILRCNWWQTVREQMLTGQLVKRRESWHIQKKKHSFNKNLWLKYKTFTSCIISLSGSCIETKEQLINPKFYFILFHFLFHLISYFILLLRSYKIGLVLKVLEYSACATWANSMIILPNFDPWKHIKYILNTTIQMF